MGSTRRSGLRRGVVIAAVIGVVLTTMAGVPAASAKTRKPTTKAQCQNNGWKKYKFKNQGACIAYVNAHSKKTTAKTTAKPVATTAKPGTAAAKGTVKFGQIYTSISASSG